MHVKTASVAPMHRDASKGASIPADAMSSRFAQGHG
jgi:hypothetical protein